MNTDLPCLDLEYMEIENEERLSERDALMLGVDHGNEDPAAFFDLER